MIIRPCFLWQFSTKSKL